MADLALRDELAHRADRLLDRNVAVDAVLVVEVDVIDTEPAQAFLAGRAHVLRPSVHTPLSAVPVVAELGREHDLLAATGDRLADQQLVGLRAIYVRGVDQVGAELQRTTHGGLTGLLLRRAVGDAHAHAAEADGSHTHFSQITLLHVTPDGSRL